TLHAASHGSLWRPRHGAGLFGSLQYQGGDRRARARYPHGARGARLMSDLRELYQDLIKNHSKKPRNFRVLEGAARQVEGYNPLCGARFTVYLQMDGDIVRDVTFQGTGCAISTASASMMTQSLKGKTRAEAEDIFQRFHHLLTGEASPAEEEELGKLAVF